MVGYEESTSIEGECFKENGFLFGIHWHEWVIDTHGGLLNLKNSDLNLIYSIYTWNFIVNLIYLHVPKATVVCQEVKQRELDDIGEYCV